MLTCIAILADLIFRSSSPEKIITGNLENILINFPKIEYNNFKVEQSLNYLEKLNLDYKPNQFDLQKYNFWVDSTLRESKTNNVNSVIVDKSKYELYLIKNGEVNLRFSIELGFNPYDDKQKEGDGCTPEGMYLIKRKLSGNQTSFYKTLFINYPNGQDLREGKTGRLIGCHGCPEIWKDERLGTKWTEGCIALSNKDIDKIFPLLDVGNRWTIVRYTSLDLNIRFGN